MCEHELGFETRLRTVNEARSRHEPCWSFHILLVEGSLPNIVHCFELFTALSKS